MPTPTLRERRKEETRRLLEAAAFRLFDLHGFTSASVDQIAAEAGVSRTTFFRYFPSKEAVIFAEEADAAKAFWQTVRERPSSENPLRAFEEALIRLARDNESDPQAKEKALARWALIAANPALRERWAKTTELRVEQLASTLARRDGLETPGPHHLIAAAVGIELVQQVNLEWQESGGELPAETLLKERFRMLRELAAG
jgi:AcrR family transcriptional regulator